MSNYRELKLNNNFIIPLESPAWHEAILNDRDAALKAGKIIASDWEEAKLRIKKNNYKGQLRFSY